SLAMAANAASISSSARTIATGAISMLVMRPASWTCSRIDRVNGSTGLARTATRLSDGSISRNSSTHFPAASEPILDKPVIFPPGRARLATRPVPIGSHHENRNLTRRLLCRQGAWCEDGSDDIDLETNQLLGQLRKSIGLCVRRTQLECII